MSEEKRAAPTSTWDQFIVCGVVIFMAVILWLMLQPVRCYGPSEKAQIIKCKNGLKQMGLSINSYYSDGTSTAMPKLKRYEVDCRNDGGYGFDANMLSCPAAHNGPCHDYVWNPKLSGRKWPDWNNTNSPLIWDASPHKKTGKVNVLLGDGHVEEMTPERLKELTR